MTIVKACFVSASHHFRALSPFAISTNRYPSQCRLPKRNALLFSPFSSIHSSSSTIFLRPAQFRNPRAFADGTETSVPDREVSEAKEYLAIDGPVFQKTLRLVECSMFAAVAGLAYFLSNSLAIENYFGCFFALPIVVSSMRWGVAAGRKTMLLSVVRVIVLGGYCYAIAYIVWTSKSIYISVYAWISWSGHGFFMAVGSQLEFFNRSLYICNVYSPNFFNSLHLFDAVIMFSRCLRMLCIVQVRAIGAIGYVLLSSFLIRENILALITINIHASLTYLLAAMGINTIPSMDAIYAIFGSLLLLNCGFFVFLLHIIYAIFLTKLGMRASLTLPRWLEKAL